MTSIRGDGVRDIDAGQPDAIAGEDSNGRWKRNCGRHHRRVLRFKRRSTHRDLLTLLRDDVLAHYLPERFFQRRKLLRHRLPNDGRVDVEVAVTPHSAPRRSRELRRGNNGSGRRGSEGRSGAYRKPGRVRVRAERHRSGRVHALPQTRRGGRRHSPAPPSLSDATRRGEDF